MPRPRQLTLLLCLLALTSLCGGVGAEDIRINDCEIRGADSFGDIHKMFRWPPGEGAPIPFAWAQFEHDGDEFCHTTSNTFSAQIHYWALTPKAYMEIKTYHANDEERSTIYELTPSPVPGDDWRTMTQAFFAIEDVQDVPLPFPAAGVHFRLRENCGNKSVVKENGSRVTVGIGNSDARFQVVSIGFAYGNWAANWMGMDFHVGDAQDNFDNFTLEHDRSTDYVQFTTQETGQCTIQAYCRKKSGEDSRVRVKVNGIVKATTGVTAADFAWVDLWTGELAGGDTIRLENDEYTTESWFGLSHTLHASCVEFSNESRYGPAFRIAVAGGGEGGNPPPPPPPPPPADTTPPVLSNIAAGPVTHQAAIIHFESTEDVQWHVEYGTTDSYGLTSPVRDFDSAKATSLSGLAPTTLYHFRIVAEDRAGNTTTTTDRTFTTAAAPDHTAPTITNVQATTTHNSITVSWSTDEPGNSMLHYGRTGSATTWTGLPEFGLQHSVTATGLTPNSQYTYWVRSADATGNVGESAHLTISTPAPPDTTAPRIVTYSVKNLAQTSATIQWRTDEPATSVVSYGTTDAYGLEASVAGMSEEHGVPLSRLQANRTYHYRIQTADAAGNLATQTGAFQTEPPDEGTVTGRVTRQGSTEANVAGATVSIKGIGSIKTTTAADGTYTLNAVPAGVRQVQCAAPGYRAAEHSVSVRRAGIVTHDFALTAVGVIHGYVNGPFRIARRGPARDQGLNGAQVRLLPGSRTTQTARGCLGKPEMPTDGHFAFADVRMGSYSVEVSLDGYVTQKIGVSISDPGQTVRQDFSMVAALRDVSTDDSALTTSPAAPTAGQRTTLTCRVTNGGNVEVRNVPVRFRWGATTIGDRSIPSIPVGATRSASLSWTIPVTVAGAEVLTATVDPDDVLDETNETNNTATRNLAVTALKPDLVVQADDITHTPAAPGVGEDTTIRLTVRNVGPVGAGSFGIALMRGTTTLTTRTKASLGAGQSYSTTISWTFPTGSYDPVELAVVVDPANSVEELDESNNRATHTIAPAKPDLTVRASEVTHSPDKPLAGTDVKLTVKVRNVGGSKATGVLLRVLGPAGVLLGEQTISSLSSDASTTKYVTWTIPDTKYGQATLTVLVDPQNAILETDETNNEVTHTLTIVAREIDLVLAATDITHSPATPEANHTVNIIAKVHNAGNVKANAVKVRFFSGTQQIGEKTITYINAGDDVATTLSWKIPAGTTGSLSIRVQVDPAGDILETNETNNEATHTVPLAG